MTVSLVAADGSVAVDIDDRALDFMRGAVRRADRRETGGILIGRYTKFGDRVCVVQATGPPSDSRSFPAAFVRGVVGLTRRLRRAWGRGVYYIGEWHSHPYASPEPSGRDLAQILDFSRDACYRCRNPILIIIGGNPHQAPTTSVHVVLDDAVVPLCEAPRKARSERVAREC